MKVYQTNEIKNIALIGAKGSGKTTLAESMLFEAGVIKRRGTVEQKNTVSDFMPVELNLGYSVFPTVFHAEWNNKKLNIIDCPGSDDFVGGAITALRTICVLLISSRSLSASSSPSSTLRSATLTMSSIRCMMCTARSAYRFNILLRRAPISTVSLMC